MIILPDWLVTSALEHPLQGWGVRVVGSQISDVAPHPTLLERYPEDERWEAEGQVLAPGFVDAHTHLYGILAHGIPLSKAPSGFMPFLEEFWWPLIENRLDREMICAATEFNCAAMIQSGITSFYDCLEAPKALPGILPAQADIVRCSGLRAILSFEATQRLGSENGRLGLAENIAFIQSALAQDGLVSGMMCFHTLFTCSADFIRSAYQMVADHNGLVHSHCSEGTFEADYTQKQFGLRPAQVYNRIGVLGDRSLLSQCVTLDPAEVELLARRNARMTHMPLSNCEVGGGIAPLPDLVDAGVRVGLGTDGYITDFFEVMRGAFLIHKAYRQDPRVMPAGLVWYLATEGGAKALGLEKVGRLAAGWQADLQIFKAQLPTPLREHNLYEQTLLFCHRSDVTGTMVAGKVLMRDGRVDKIDQRSQLDRVQRSAERLWTLGETNPDQ